MKKINGLIFAIFWAANTYLSTAFAIYRPEIFFSIDPAFIFVRPGMTQDLKLVDNIGNTYVNKSHLQQQGSVIIGLGLRAYKNQFFQLSSSLRYLPIGETSLKGDIWQLNSPLFNDLAYQFKVKSSLWLWDNIFSFSRYPIQPGIILGLGSARNTTSQMKEIPLAVSTSPSLQNVPGTTQQQFTYEVGGVIDYAIETVNIELAYRYINAGNGVLLPFPLQNTQDQLSTGALQYQILSLGIRGYYDL